jgi:hypothetical protein
MQLPDAGSRLPRQEANMDRRRFLEKSLIGLAVRDVVPGRVDLGGDMTFLAQVRVS